MDGRSVGIVSKTENMYNKNHIHYKYYTYYIITLTELHRLAWCSGSSNGLGYVWWCYQKTNQIPYCCRIFPIPLFLAQLLEKRVAESDILIDFCVILQV